MAVPEPTPPSSDRWPSNPIQNSAFMYLATSTTTIISPPIHFAERTRSSDIQHANTLSVQVESWPSQCTLRAPARPPYRAPRLRPVDPAGASARPSHARPGAPPPTPAPATHRAPACLGGEEAGEEQLAESMMRSLMRQGRCQESGETAGNVRVEGARREASRSQTELAQRMLWVFPQLWKYGRAETPPVGEDPRQSSRAVSGAAGGAHHRQWRAAPCRTPRPSWPGPRTARRAPRGSTPP